MKAAQRLVYRALSEDVHTELCTWCRYVRSFGGGLCDYDGWRECHHPVYMMREGEVPALGDDCWAFRSAYPVADIADIVGIVLAQGWTRWVFTDGPLTVRGRTWMRLPLELPHDN